MSEVSVTKKMLDTLRSRRTVKEEAAQKEFKVEGVEKDNFLCVVMFSHKPSIG